jgi:hypothetical protein
MEEHPGQAGASAEHDASTSALGQAAEAAGVSVAHVIG